MRSKQRLFDRFVGARTRAQGRSDERLERDLKMMRRRLRLTMLITSAKSSSRIREDPGGRHQRAGQIGATPDNLKDLIGGLERNLDGTISPPTRVAARANDEKKALDSRTDAAGSRPWPAGPGHRFCVSQEAPAAPGERRQNQGIRGF